MEADYRRLKALKNAGSLTRDEALHLLFMAWMHWADPPHLTGLEDDPGADGLWHALFAGFGGEDSADAEFLHVAGLMANLFPWELGPVEEWEARSVRMMSRALELRPDGFSPDFFEGRGEYGAYFAHQAGGRDT